MTPPRTIRGFHSVEARHAGTHDTYGELHSNATLRDPITLYGCGRIGSADYTRTLPAGTRVEELELDPAGLARIRWRPDDTVGALVDVEHLEPDTITRDLAPPVAEAYATDPADATVTVPETDDNDDAHLEEDEWSSNS